MLGDHADGTKPHRKRKLIWGQILHYLLSLTSNYKSEVYDCNLVDLIHEMMVSYRVLISVILLPILQRLYTSLSAVLNISETCVCNAALISSSFAVCFLTLSLTERVSLNLLSNLNIVFFEINEYLFAITAQ